MQHLLDFFDRYLHGDGEALVYHDGFRRWTYTFDQVRAAADAFAGRLMKAGLQPGDRIAIWSESRPEWIAAFWGCMLRGVAVIPLDARASPELAGRTLAAASPRVLLIDGDREPPASSLPVWRLSDIEWMAVRPSANTPRATVTPDTVAEIVFTSGTTGDPKGVVITHRNIIANIIPIERAAARYHRYIWVLSPLRFLGLLPLSHMFGQALSIFLPPLVTATTVFISGYNPDEIIRQVRRQRITLVVTIPRMLDLLRARVTQLMPRCREPSANSLPLRRRLWRYRQVHRLFGWRFLGFVVGGAQLDGELEAFWRRLAFVVVQGYGLTETAPIVAWNDPFRTKRGTVGEPLEGMDVRIAPDGEVLVRGPALTAGYLNAPSETGAAFEGGWFHTGDIGSFDDSGRLVIRGRKKDVIVTAEGLHVFPEDVEQVLMKVSGVREAAVVRHVDGGERVHAVLVLDPGADAGTVVGEANGVLESHQRIKEFSVWPDAALPRTEAIRKLKREEIRRWVQEGVPGQRPAAPQAGAVEQVLARYAHNRPVSPQTTLDELGLTSLDRVELGLALEAQAGVGVGETALAESLTVADLHRAVDQARRAAPVDEPMAFPRWAQSRIAGVVRETSQRTWILPLVHLFLRLRVEGREHLEGIADPVIFAANHQSHFDVPAILLSLRPRWRRRTSVAMAREFFDAYFAPAGHPLWRRVLIGAMYYLAALFFNAFPLPRTGPGARATLRYAGGLATAGFSILIFPEGHRTERGEIGTFQPGVGMMASRLRLPVVPVRLEGLDRVLHHTWRWPRRGTVRVVFGTPLELDGDDYGRLTRRVEGAVVALLPDAAQPARVDDQPSGRSASPHAASTAAFSRFQCEPFQ